MSASGPPRSSPPPPYGLAGLVERSRVVVCVGAGGVGKTTVAAALALRAARAGRRVVCLTIDPARRLADSLGVEGQPRGGEVRDITALIGDDAAPGGRLAFGMLDPAETFRAFVRDRASSPAQAERILRNRLYRYLSSSLSGLQEYMALEKLYEIRAAREVDLVVLDTPPTANAFDFFTAPRRMVEALDGVLVRTMRKAYGGPRRLGLDLVGRWAGGALKAIGRVTGAELLEEIVGFVDALADLFGSFTERASTVESVLAGEEVAFVLVTTPDRATLREARELRQRLAGLGLAVHGVVFNRAHSPRVPPPPPDAPAALAEQLSPHTVEWNAAALAEERLEEQVRAAWEEVAAVAVTPLLPSGATRLEALERLGRSL